MRFRTVILLGLLTVVVAIVGLTSWVAARTVEQDARVTLDQDLDRGALVLEEVLAQRQSLLNANAKVVADEPRLRAVVATEDIDQATLFDVSTEMRRAIGSDLFLLTDAQGVLLADTADEAVTGVPMAERPVVADALSSPEGTAAGIWIDGSRVFQMASRRMAFGETVVGVLVVGWEIDDSLVAAAAPQAGGALVVMAADQAVASSLPPGTTRGELPAGADQDGAHVDVAIDGGPYRAVVGHLPGDGQLRYLVLRSLDDALATSRRLAVQIYAVGGGAVLVAIVLALWLSWRLSRPLHGLVDFTEQIASGRLDDRLQPQGPRELSVLGEAMNRMAQQLAASREQLAAKERLEREMEIATRIQTSILPVEPALAGYSIGASMETASEVGGDYYDVIPTSEGGWIAIGDVAGHGLPAGIVMLMLQSATGTLVRSVPDADPSALVTQLNTFLFDNIRVRLLQDEYVTFTLLRLGSGGEVIYAGAHEEIVVWRKATGQCETRDTLGPWLGVLHDVEHATEDQTLQLQPGDLMLLYTDGVTEAMNESREQFGMTRLRELVETHAERPPAELVERIRNRVDAWCSRQVDDVTMLAVRYEGSSPEPE